MSSNPSKRKNFPILSIWLIWEERKGKFLVSSFSFTYQFSEEMGHLVLWHPAKKISEVFSFLFLKAILLWIHGCLRCLRYVSSLLLIFLLLLKFVPSLDSKNLFTFAAESFRYDPSTLRNSLTSCPSPRVSQFFNGLWFLLVGNDIQAPKCLELLIVTGMIIVFWTFQ